MIDINKEKVEGEVMDIEQGTCFRSPISIIAGDYEDAKGSDIVIITSGIARKPGQTRIELAQTNVNIIKSITPEIVKAAPDAKYICWIQHVSATVCPDISTLHRKIFMLMYTASTAILPSFRGQELILQVCRSMTTTRQ